MAQHDYTIANQGFPAFRSDLNDALAAIVSNNSGATEPTTMFAHQMWVDTAANPSVLKIRNADNDAWITLGVLDQTGDTFILRPAAGSASVPAYSTTSDTNTGVYFPGADRVGITTGGTQRVEVDASGNVGIGVTPSAWTSTFKALQVKQGSISADNSSNTTFANNCYFDGSNWKYINSAAAQQYLQFSGQHIWTTAASGTAGNNISFTSAMTLDASGNLMVGTTTATARVSITGSASTSAMLNVINQSAPSVAASMGLGTTQAASATDIAFAVQYGNGSIVTNNSLFIRTNGNVENTNNSYGAFSDIKLKQDIVDAGSQWDDIKGLRVRKYRFKSDPNAPLQIGLVAQEVEEVSAGLVGESPDYEQVTRTREVEKTRVVTEAVLDKDGNEIEPAVTETYTEEEEYTERVALDTTTKSVKYSVLYMKAVKALQEAMERIETLEAKVAALENA